MLVYCKEQTSLCAVDDAYRGTFLKGKYLDLFCKICTLIYFICFETLYRIDTLAFYRTDSIGVQCRTC